MTRVNNRKPGEWLKHERERRDMSVRELATKLDVATQVIYDWQNGKNAVSDKRAEEIARVFRMNIIDVRRELGLWVPPEHREDTDRDEDIENLSVSELARRIKEMTDQLARHHPEEEEPQRRREA